MASLHLNQALNLNNSASMLVSRQFSVDSNRRVNLVVAAKRRVNLVVAAKRRVNLVVAAKRRANFVVPAKRRGPLHRRRQPPPQNPFKKFIAIILRKLKEFAAWVSQSISRLIPQTPFVIKLLWKVFAYVEWLKKSLLKDHFPFIIQFSCVAGIILYLFYRVLYPLYTPFLTLWYWSRDLIYTTARKLKLWILPPPPKRFFVTTVFRFLRVGASRLIMAVYSLSGSPLFPHFIGFALTLFFLAWLLYRDD
ncbi:hypothetical protein Hdeb2414_s0562g00917051 [Helianthus debilis subsp. tardiflorus]